MKQSYDVKRLVNQDNKQKIAQTAYKMMKDGDKILLDALITDREFSSAEKKELDKTGIKIMSID